MIIRGFDRETMKKIFDKGLVNCSEKDKKGNFMLFTNWTLSHKEHGSVANLDYNKTNQNEIDNDFKNFMALLYLKTFYMKKPSDFKTKVYKKESEKFNNFINNYSNPSLLRDKIEQCLRSNMVDFSSNYLPRELFYERLAMDGVGLSKDSDLTDIFVGVTPRDCVRIYVNPSTKDYSHFMKFLYEQVSKQELVVNAKTRMGTTKTLDNLILYVPFDNFFNLINILNDYEKKYSDKVLEFGGTMECLARNEHDWYGFGFQSEGKNSSYSFDINRIFNYYIIPMILLKDFSEITKGMNLEQITHILSYIMMDRTGKIVNSAENLALIKELALIFDDPVSRIKIINEFYDLSHVKDDPDNDPHYSKDKRFHTDVYYLCGKSILGIKERMCFSKIIKNPLFRDAIKKYYNTPGKMDEVADRMVELWKYVGKSLPYLNDEYPFFSDAFVKFLEKNHKIKKDGSSLEILDDKKNDKFKKWEERQLKKHEHYKEIISILCGGKYRLASKIIELGISSEKIENASREKLERLYIEKIGIDTVIDAARYFESINNGKDFVNNRYENSLFALRLERGKKLCKKFEEDAKTSMDNTFVSKLSLYEMQDIVNAYSINRKLSQTFDTVNHVVKSSDGRKL